MSEILVNNQIVSETIRLTSPHSTQTTIITLEQGLAMAEEDGLDLICLSSHSIPPVCMIGDVGKYKYELEKKEKEKKRNQKTIETKEIRLSPNIEANDIRNKTDQAKKFLERGDKVKVTLRFRGREIMHAETHRAVLERFVDGLSDVATMAKLPSMEGKSMSVMLEKKREEKKREKKERKPAAEPVTQTA